MNLIFAINHQVIRLILKFNYPIFRLEQSIVLQIAVLVLVTIIIKFKHYFFLVFLIDQN